MNGCHGKDIFVGVFLEVYPLLKLLNLLPVSKLTISLDAALLSQSSAEL